MLTPTFSVDQDDEFVHLSIKVPFLKTQAVEFHIQERNFKFYASPYYLSITFPKEIVEDGREKASYNVSEGLLEIRLPKAEKGPFDDLQMITQLIKPSKPLSQVLDEKLRVSEISVVSPGGAIESKEKEEEEEEGELDWEFPCEYLPNTLIIGSAKYGFNDQYENLGSHIVAVSHEVFEIESPDSCTLQQRREIRINNENLRFDEEAYIHDKLNPEIEALISFKPVFYSVLRHTQSNATSHPWLSLTEEETKTLINLKSKDYLIQDPVPIYLGVVDILFAYCYNHRTTLGENTVESWYAISKVCSTFACFEKYTSLSQVLHACIRRSLVYPLYRNTELALQCIKDVCVLLKLGKLAVLKAFLGVKKVLDGNESSYVFSRLYVNDYCVWIQTASDKQIRSLASMVHHFTLSGNEVLGFDLDTLDTVAEELKREGYDLDDDEMPLAL